MNSIHKCFSFVYVSQGAMLSVQQYAQSENCVQLRLLHMHVFVRVRCLLPILETINILFA